MKQQSFAHYDEGFKSYWKNENRKFHGGKYAVGKRKTRRPLSTTKPIHLILKSEIARGAMSLRTIKNWKRNNEIIKKYADKFDVRIYEHSINSNHIHIACRTKSRMDFQNFLRTIAGLIARYMLGAERGNAKGSFWTVLAFTQVSEWGRAYNALKNYVVQNILEAAGVISYKPRKISVMSG